MATRCALVVQVLTLYCTVSPVERVKPRDTFAVGLGPKSKPTVGLTEVLVLLVTLNAPVSLGSGFVTRSSIARFRYCKQISWKYNSWPSLRKSAWARKQSKF
jgi:hypothetical protein